MPNQNRSDLRSKSPFFGLWRGPFTGRHMLIFMILFFAVIIAANIYLVSAAVRTYPGEDIKQSYRQGLAYNQTLQNRSDIKSRGWQAKIKAQAGTVFLTIQDQYGEPVRGLTVQGRLKHPARTQLDVPLAFIFDPAQNAYLAAYPKGTRGRYILVSQAYDKKPTSTLNLDPVFKTKNTMMIKAP